jgi:hypothetical protein
MMLMMQQPTVMNSLVGYLPDTGADAHITSI